MKNILITGSNGQLGSELKTVSNIFDFNFIFTDIDNLDITKSGQLNEFFKNNNIDYIINCAAYTAVDKAEEEREKARLINVTAVENIINVAGKYNCKLIHISTDYVFDGEAEHPYKENSRVNPQSVYGLTKLEAEQLIMTSGLQFIIIRTSWLYSFYGNNFVKTMLRIGNEKKTVSVVNDQTGTPCYAYDLATAILTIVDKTIHHGFVNGIYHYSNKGVCTWYDFAKEIFKIAGIKCEVLPVATKNYPTLAKRPKYSVLDKNLIQNTFNVDIPYWKDSLKKCLDRLLA